MKRTREQRELLYIRAAAVYGVDTQFNIAMEEAAEFIKALSKYRRYGTEKSKKDLIEELADLRNVLNQVAHILDIEDACRLAAEAKLDRLEDRLNK